MLEFLLGIVEQGLIYAPIVLGVYITYSILDFPDLSVDGTFPLGAAVTAVCMLSGMNPLLAILISMAAGAAAGFVTGALHVYLKITNLLCGILTMIALYSVNLHIMGEKSNLPLFNVETVFTTAIPKVVVALLFVLLIKMALDIYMKTYAGKSLLAVGVNEQLVTTLSINTDASRSRGSRSQTRWPRFRDRLWRNIKGSRTPVWEAARLSSAWRRLSSGVRCLQKPDGFKDRPRSYSAP